MFWGMHQRPICQAPSPSSPHSMTIEIIKGLKYFYVLLLVLYMSFAVAFTNLFQVTGVSNTGNSSNSWTRGG